jgi:ferredoxin-fold anticodon binding domain-containing protein
MRLQCWKKPPLSFIILQNRLGKPNPVENIFSNRTHLNFFDKGGNGVMMAKKGTDEIESKLS